MSDANSIVRVSYGRMDLAPANIQAMFKMQRLHLPPDRSSLFTVLRERHVGAESSEGHLVGETNSAVEGLRASWESLSDFFVAIDANQVVSNPADVITLVFIINDSRNREFTADVEWGTQVYQAISDGLSRFSALVANCTSPPGHNTTGDVVMIAVEPHHDDSD